MAVAIDPRTLSIDKLISGYTITYNKLNKIPDYPLTAPFNITDIFNAIIVKNNGRSAFLPSTQDAKLASRIIVTLFPDLAAIPHATLPHITIIVKKGSVFELPHNEEELGTLLGYPCASDFAPLVTDLSLPREAYEINAILKNDVAERYELHNKQIQLVPFICKDRLKNADINALFESVKTALMSQPGIEDFVEDIILKHKHIDSLQTINGIPIALPFMEGGRRRRRRQTKRRKRRTSRR